MIDDDLLGFTSPRGPKRWRSKGPKRPALLKKRKRKPATTTAPLKRPRRRSRSAPPSPPHRWFTDERANAIADWLAHNAAIDRALGVEPSPDRWPYSQFKRPAVVLFLERIKREYPGDRVSLTFVTG